MTVNGYYIMSLEAIDIYEQELVNGKEVGYRLPLKKNKKYFDLFNTVLDYSLDLYELEKEYKNKCRREFSFEDDNNNRYTLALINVKFNLICKNDLDMPIKTCKELRQYFYENGFNVGKIHYVRYKRSSGSSREGKCLFIDEKMLNHMEKWGECKLKRNDKDLASWEAYKSLSLSSIKGLVDIPLEGILFINDCKSKFLEEVVSVEEENGKLVSNVKESEINNNIWDGESLLDESLFKDEFKGKHMLLLRHKFFKSCGFRTKLQKWFKDKNITLDALKEKGFITLASDISQIVMVTTPSSMKFLKFMNGGLTLNNVKNWMEHIDSKFGVVKYDKRTKFFDGDMVRTSYQFLNTLPLSEEQVKTILEPTKKYIATLREDYDFMRYHFSHAYKREKDYDDEDEIADGLAERSDVIFTLMNINYDFKDTKTYIKFRDDVIADQKKKVKEGHILLSGTNATLFGNGPEMLLALSGEFDISNNDNEPFVLNKGEIACKKFIDKEKLVCARSPHITMGNLYCVTNNLSSPLWDYFDLGNNIVCVNAIKENVQQRLNGCDYDSDSMLITNDEQIVLSAFSQKDRFKVPVCNIEPSGNADQALFELDHNTSVNKIGDIVNLSQLLNSYLWDRLNNDPSFDINPIYECVCKLAVLSGIEIDKAKRAYDNINVIKELANIKKMNNEEHVGYFKIERKEICYPKFFKEIHSNSVYAKKNKKKKKEDVNIAPPKKKTYEIYHCPMEYIYKETNGVDFRRGKEKKKEYLPILDMINIPSTRNCSSDYHRKDQIIHICEEYKNKINKLYASLRTSDEDSKEFIYNKIKEEKLKQNEKIGEYLNEYVLYLVIKEFEKEGKDNWMLYAPLLQCQMFIDMLKESKRTMKKVVRSDEGEFNIYHLKFTKK